MRCFACKGVYHEASGHLLVRELPYCGPCYRHWLAWFRSLSRRWEETGFYKHALVSCSAQPNEEKRT